jgi:hypothetical protein
VAIAEAAVKNMVKTALNLNLKITLDCSKLPIRQKVTITPFATPKY